MKPEHAANLQNIQDLDGDSKDDLCKRSDCWDRQAGVVVCWVFTAGGEDGRCGACDHLTECHDPNGEADQKAFFASLMREVDEGAAKARKNLEVE